jgi:dCMP deaminase
VTPAVHWDGYFMNLAAMVATKSKDRSTKVGCVVVGPDNEIRSTGYNSFPRGINDDAPERHERPEKYLWTEHSERNAIYNAARMGTALKGCRLYTSLMPCMDCARAIVQAGIVEVVTPDFEGDGRNANWTEQHRKSEQLFREASVQVRFIGKGE